jgi:hypothetical protein
MGLYDVTATGDGASEVINLPPGRYLLEITATTWDGATAVLESAGSGGFDGLDDPYNSGNEVSRTSDGQLVGAFGGARYRLNVSDYGDDTAGLRLIAHQATK